MLEPQYPAMVKQAKEPHRQFVAQPESEVMQIARRLEIVRVAFGLTSADLCRKTGIKPNAWSNYTTGLGRPSLDAAKLLRKHFGVTLDWIYEGDRSTLPFHVLTKIVDTETKYAGLELPKRPGAN